VSFAPPAPRRARLPIPALCQGVRSSQWVRATAAARRAARSRCSASGRWQRAVPAPARRVAPCPCR
jgi:hypothetical protein